MMEAFYEGIKQIRVAGGPTNTQRAEASSMVHVESRIRPVAALGDLSSPQLRREHKAEELAYTFGRYSSDLFGKLMGTILASVTRYQPWVLNMAQLSSYWEVAKLAEVSDDRPAVVEIRVYTGRDKTTVHGGEIIVPTALPSRGFLRFVSQQSTYLMKVITDVELGREPDNISLSSLPKLLTEDMEFFGGAVEALAKSIE